MARRAERKAPNKLVKKPSRPGKFLGVAQRKRAAAQWTGLIEQTMPPSEPAGGIIIVMMPPIIIMAGGREDQLSNSLIAGQLLAFLSALIHLAGTTRDPIRSDTTNEPRRNGQSYCVIRRRGCRHLFDFGPENDRSFGARKSIRLRSFENQWRRRHRATFVTQLPVFSFRDAKSSGILCALLMFLKLKKRKM